MVKSERGKVARSLPIIIIATLLATLGMTGTANAASTVTVAGQTHALNGTNIYRSTNYLVLYTPAKGATTGTNQYGYEAAVVDGVVTKVENGIGNMAIPSNGFVLSGHGDSRTWLATYAKVGAPVVLDGTTTPPPPSGASELLPDVGIRTLRQFSIVNANGVKLLKFPGVTANIGAGPMEVKATRTATTNTNWVGSQTIYLSDGTKKSLPAASQTFYWAGDGHAHWHIRDFDAYELFDPNGQKLRNGEKHGFCFEDNTSYRDWPGNPKHPAAPAQPVYTHESSCGHNDVNALSITHGLSVGWGDTYPVSLPDQGINVTGLPDGVYVVKITADWQNFYKESNESNNSASARVQITGNSVTLLSANDGL